MPISKCQAAVCETLQTTYDDLRKKGSLNLMSVKEYKQFYYNMFDMRCEALETQDVGLPNEYDETKFLKESLQQGWLISDIPMLIAVYDFAASSTGENRLKMSEFIKAFREQPVETIEERNDLLNDVLNFISPLDDTKDKEKVITEINKAFAIKPVYAEYPKDPGLIEEMESKKAFDSHVVVKKHQPFVLREALLNSAEFRNKLTELDKQPIREKTDYVMNEKSDEDLEEYVPSFSQEVWNMQKSNREAIKEVFGDDVYDSINEAHKGSAAERKVKIHHALGTKAIKNGEEVLEIDLAGSGYSEARREYKGLHGKSVTDAIDQAKLDDGVYRQFGQKEKNSKGVEYDHIRSRTTKVPTKDGEKLKTRYTIAGPSPHSFSGAFNLGKYSIESTKAYAKKYASKFIFNLFEEWRTTGKEPHKININITGHSRGAVSAGYSVKLIDKWVKDYVEEHPDCKHFADQVHYNLVMRDPVPGFLTKLRLGGNDLNGVINSVHEGKSVQKTRVTNIQKMTRNWFLDNDLQMSYNSEEQRVELNAKANDKCNTLLGYKVKRLRDVQTEIKNLDKLLMEGAKKEDILAQNDRLIRACREYMKKTSLPAEGDSAVKLGLVNDVLSHAMREKNYMTKGLDNLNSMEALIKEVSETCNTTLKTLSTIRVGKSNGKEYKEFIKAVELGSKLSIYDNPELIRKTLEDISEKASDYEYVHSELQAPLSKEGIKRRKEINDMENFADKKLSIVKKQIAGIADKDTSIYALKEKQFNKIDSLERIKDNGGVITESEKVRRELNEKIRIEREKLNKFNKSNNKALLRATVPEIIQAKLDYLTEIRNGAMQTNFANPESIHRAIDEPNLNKIILQTVAMANVTKNVQKQQKGLVK